MPISVLHCIYRVTRVWSTAYSGMYWYCRCYCRCCCCCCCCLVVPRRKVDRVGSIGTAVGQHSIGRYGGVIVGCTAQPTTQYSVLRTPYTQATVIFACACYPPSQSQSRDAGLGLECGVLQSTYEFGLAESPSLAKSVASLPKLSC